MRFTPLIILVPALVLTACGKKDLEPEPEPVPAPTPNLPRTPETRNLLAPGTTNPFRVPDATSKLPDEKDTRATTTPTIPSGPAHDTATVTARPPAPKPPASDNNE